LKEAAMSQRNDCQRGITLLGLIVVILIVIGVIFLLRPIFRRFYQGSYQAACTNNLRQIGEALQHYLNDFGDIVPPAQWSYGSTAADNVRWNQALAGDVRAGVRETVFQCPAKTSAKIGYAVNYRTFRNNRNPKAAKQNFVTTKQIRNPGETIYALDTGHVTSATKDLDSDQWKEESGDAPELCRCTRSDEYWKEDPVRPMPRHAGKVNCLMLDGSVTSHTVDEIVVPKEKSSSCLWDAY
jgi:prepilin-type processing-associated H-X9-DG protein